MKLIISTIVFLVGTNALAQTSTKYDRIKELYDTGTAATLADLNDVWAGRCFQSTDRDRAMRSVFGLPLVTDDSAGPEFGTEKFTIFVYDPYGSEYPKASYLEDFRGHVVVPTETPSGIELTYDAEQFSIRKNGAYIMLFNISADIHCYYFQPLK